MKAPLKHGLIALICLLGSIIVFSYAIILGTGLLERSEAPARHLITQLLTAAGKTNPQYVQKRDIAEQRQIVFIIAVISVGAGIGLTIGLEELFKTVVSTKGKKFRN